MGYNIDNSTGTVTNDVDNSQVAPTQDTNDPAYVEYINWIAQGNTPRDVTPSNIVVPRWITKFAFRSRFTAPEKIAIDFASLDDPTSSMAQRQMAAALRVYLKDMETAEFVDLDRQDIRDSLNSLAAIGILSAARVVEILDAEVQPVEMWSL